MEPCNAMEICAAGDRCKLGGFAPDTHRCPECRRSIHVLCGTVVEPKPGLSIFRNVVCGDCTSPIDHQENINSTQNSERSTQYEPPLKRKKTNLAKGGNLDNALWSLAEQEHKGHRANKVFFYQKIRAQNKVSHCETLPMRLLQSM
jgi:hypothetical protein